MKLNSPSSEMKEHNRGDVIYDRLVLTDNLVVTMYERRNGSGLSRFGFRVDRVPQRAGGMACHMLRGHHVFEFPQLASLLPRYLSEQEGIDADDKARLGYLASRQEEASDHIELYHPRRVFGAVPAIAFADWPDHVLSK
jgi:hypothetical protein